MDPSTSLMRRSDPRDEDDEVVSTSPRHNATRICSNEMAIFDPTRPFVAGFFEPRELIKLNN
jgi:hypothetical protein